MTETWLQPLKYVCLTGLPAVHIHMSSTEKCSSDHESKKKSYNGEKRCWSSNLYIYSSVCCHFPNQLKVEFHKSDPVVNLTLIFMLYKQKFRSCFVQYLELWFFVIWKLTHSAVWSDLSVFLSPSVWQR